MTRIHGALRYSKDKVLNDMQDSVFANLILTDQPHFSVPLGKPEYRRAETRIK